MLDNLDNGGRVEILQPVVPVDERALQQLDAPALKIGHIVEPEPLGGRGEHPGRHFHPNDAGKAAMLDQLTKQHALAAAAIDDGHSSEHLERSEERRVGKESVSKCSTRGAAAP